MQQPFDKYLMFRNRLTKVDRHLSKLARKAGISCFRIYDHDLPEFPFIIERYQDKLYVSEYKRRHLMDEEVYQDWLQQCRIIMSEVLAVPEENIFIKLRKRKEDRQDQYQKLSSEQTEFVVEENQLKFIVNLSDYLDTGLFLDHRITREMVRSMAKGKRVLNLFCYTGSFSVYALAGNAKEVVSVDLSKTYLNWVERNLALNFSSVSNHFTIHADVKKYLKEYKGENFDIVVMDPPTFSNSKRMDDILDIQRDHVELINDCLQILNPGGLLIFSTNMKTFKLDQANIKSALIKDITKATTPFDFQGKLHRLCYTITK